MKSSSTFQVAETDFSQRHPKQDIPGGPPAARTKPEVNLQKR